MKHFHKAAFFAGLILLISACVTQRKKGETGWFGKRYHNMTAKYNGYFNAKVADIARGAKGRERYF